MLGHRGVRLGITYPEITEMQTRAIIEAACQLNKEGLKVVPEIMIPLVGHVKELRDQKAIVDRVAAETMKEQGVKIKYLVGTMIEVPRGALTADEIAAGGAVLLVRHQRPDAADLRLLARRRRQVPADLSGQEDPRQGSVRVDRRRGRRRARAASACSRAARRGRTSSSASAASTAAIRRRSTSSRRSASTTSALAVPRAGGAPGGGAGGAVGQGRRLSVVITIFVHRDGRTEQATSLDRAWLDPASGAFVWVDLAAPSIPESLILSDTFALPSAVGRGRDARACTIRRSRPTTATSTSSCTASTSRPASTGSRPTTSTSSSGRNYLVTVHDGHSRSIARAAASICPRNPTDPRRGPGRAAPPHRRHDGRPLPAGGREARGAARRAREGGVRRRRARR